MSSTNKRRQLEAEIFEVKLQIKQARKLGQEVDALSLRLAILRSDLLTTCPGVCFTPPYMARIKSIQC